MDENNTCNLFKQNIHYFWFILLLRTVNSMGWSFSADRILTLVFVLFHLQILTETLNSYGDLFFWLSKAKLNWSTVDLIMDNSSWCQVAQKVPQYRPMKPTIAPITHLSDLHFKHRGEANGREVFIFENPHMGIHLKLLYMFGFRLNTRQCNCRQRGHLRCPQPCGRRLSLLGSENRNRLEEHIQTKTTKVQTKHFQRGLSSVIYLVCFPLNKSFLLYCNII